MTLRREPIDLKLDDNHDLIIPLQRTSGPAAVRQAIDIRLGMIRGEWFADRNRGVPWFENDIVPEYQALLGQAFDEGRARHEIRKAILDAPNVNPASLVLELAYDSATRTMECAWTIDTLFGDTINGVFTREIPEEG